MLLCALILYLATLDNGFQPEELRGGDLITHQYAQVQARPSNAPGYPIYTMGGWLWFHGWQRALQLIGLPLFNPIQLLSGYSLVWALVALWFLYQIIDELMGEKLSDTVPSNLGSVAASSLLGENNKPSIASPFPGLFPGPLLQQRTNFTWLLCAFYAVTYFFWFYATTTEQYTSAIAQTLAIFYCYQRFEKREHQGAPLLLAFLCGLSLAHMLTVAFIVPPLVLVILWQAPWLWQNLRAIVGSVLAAGLPLVSYIYVYVRGRSHPEWWGEGNWQTPTEWFWSFVSTAQGRDELARGFEAWCGPWAGGFPAGMWRELSLPLLILGMVGIAFLGKRRSVLLYGTLIIYLAFCWMYRCGNWFQVILPVYPLILLGLIPLVRHYWQMIGDTSSWLVLVPQLLLVVAIGWRVNTSWPQVNSRDRLDDTALADSVGLLNDSIPLGSALFATLDDALALQYLNQIWRIRPDVEIADHKEARRRIDNGQFVLTQVDSVPQLLTEMREETSIGIWSVSADWVAIQDVAFIDEDSYGDPEVLLNRSIEAGVELVGYTILSEKSNLAIIAEPSPSIEIQLYWRLSNPPWPDGLSISVRPMNASTFIPLTSIDPAADPNLIIQQDQKRPLQGLEPISQIPAGQHFGDAYRVPLPTMDAVDNIMVILYRETAGGFKNVAEVKLGCCNE